MVLRMAARAAEEVIYVDRSHHPFAAVLGRIA
jgi:hypothetical protein